METCTFDNPIYMCREVWRDGKLEASISLNLMYSKGFNGHRTMHMGLNVGKDFIAGKVYGDNIALIEELK